MMDGWMDGSTGCRFNKENIFAEDSLDMGFICREPIINATFGDIRFRRCERRRCLLCAVVVSIV